MMDYDYGPWAGLICVAIGFCVAVGVAWGIDRAFEAFLR